MSTLLYLITLFQGHSHLSKSITYSSLVIESGGFACSFVYECRALSLPCWIRNRKSSGLLLTGARSTVEMQHGLAAKFPFTFQRFSFWYSNCVIYPVT